jgi:hypothetical protein
MLQKSGSDNKAKMASSSPMPRQQQQQQQQQQLPAEHVIRRCLTVLHANDF